MHPTSRLTLEFLNYDFNNRNSKSARDPMGGGVLALNNLLR